MRRLDPNNWIQCRTCLQQFNYEPFYKYSNLKTALLSYILDRRWLLRTIIFSFTTLIASFLPLNKYYHQFLTSTIFWQMVSFKLSLFIIIIIILFFLFLFIFSILNGK